METQHFLKHLAETNQITKLSNINADGTPNMKYKNNRDLYHEYLYNSIPSFECSICMETLENSGCKMKCGHYFCVDCFSNLARVGNKCALCRSNLSETSVKKEVDQNALIDIVNYELETPYAERGNQNVREYIYDQMKKLVETDKPDDDTIANIADTVSMEVFDSLHAVAYIVAETVNNQEQVVE